MTALNVHILNTPPELHPIALLGVKAALDYGYEGRKAYTFYFYNRYKVKVQKISTGFSVKVSEIG